MAKFNKKASGQEKGSFFSEISAKFKQSPILYIGSVFILILVLVAFLGGDFISGGGLSGMGGDMVFGYYNKVPISLAPENNFHMNYQNIFQFYRFQGRNIEDIWIWRQAYEMTVMQTAILNILNRSNYAAPERIINRAVSQLPMFQENGRFSAALYNQLSKSRQDALWKQEQEKFITTMYFDDIFGLLVPQAEAIFFADMTSPMRSFEMVSFNINNYPEQELLSFAMENARLFDSSHLSMITITSSEREARSIHSSILNGSTTFEDAARNHSDDNYASRGGDMGYRSIHELNYGIPDPADQLMLSTLARGEISSVITTIYGWAIYRAENEMIPADFEDENVLDKVRSYLRNNQRGILEDWALAQARNFSLDAQESGFNNTARLRNMDIANFGPLPINFGGVDLYNSLESFSATSDLASRDIQGLTSNENFWRIAFSTQLNTPGEPFVQGDNVFVLIPIEQTYPDEGYMNSIITYIPFWINNTLEQSMQSYFVNKEEMEDNFWSAYFRFLN